MPVASFQHSEGALLCPQNASTPHTTGRPKGTTKDQAAKKHKKDMEEYQRQRDNNPNIRRSARRNK